MIPLEVHYSAYHSEWSQTHTGHIVWFHLNKVQGQPKLNHKARSQDNKYLGDGGCIDWAGHEFISEVMEMFYIFISVAVKYKIQISVYLDLWTLIYTSCPQLKKILGGDHFFPFLRTSARGEKAKFLLLSVPCVCF